MPGIDVHAQVLEHLLTGTFLERPDYAVALEEFVILALGIMLAVVLPRVSAKASAAIGLLTIALVLVGGWAAFQYANMLLDPSYPALFLGFMTAGITLYTYNTAEVQRAHIRSAFGQYLAPALVEQLAHSPEKLVLGGEERNMTILFSDVRGFTAISEIYKDDPQGLTSLMNRLLTPLTNTIVDHDGTVDKYIGDAVMAFWNAPLDVPHHELSACAAALAMLDNVRGAQSAASGGDCERRPAVPAISHRRRHKHRAMRCRQSRIRPALQLFGSRRSGKRRFTLGGPDKILRCSDYPRIEDWGKGQGKICSSRT